MIPVRVFDVVDGRPSGLASNPKARRGRARCAGAAGIIS